ncbi:MAG: hypothetical protein JF609_08300 [Verrucomicrobia bacterium]|nr:hypothetical protein [Verrucomicrobiota bacterium]
MKMMFCVLGEGRGHMTQAMAVKEMAESAGHELVAVTLGVSAHRQVPEYFESAMKTPIRRLPTLEFKYKDSKAVSNTATLLGVLGNLPKYRRIIRQLDEVVRETKPDVIINFFEPIAAFYALTRRDRPPIVAIGHQFMFQHPGYVKTPELWKQLFSMKLYTRLLGARATKLALSFDHRRPANLAEATFRFDAQSQRRLHARLSVEPRLRGTDHQMERSQSEDQAALLL